MINKIKNLSLMGKILYITGAVKRIEIKNLILRKYHPVTIAILGVSYVLELIQNIV